MVCSPDDLRACFADAVEYRGAVYLAFDIGEASSGTSACAFYPVTGALRTWLAFGETPTLADRAKRDGADYLAMERRGELRTYPGRTVPVKAFVADVRADLAGANVRLAVADEYKSAELRDCYPLAVNGRADRGGAGWERGGPGVSIGDFDKDAGAPRESLFCRVRSKNRRCGGDG